MKNAHSNISLLNTDTSEGFMLREAIAFRTKNDWGSLRKKIPFANKQSEREFKLAKKEADRNFQNETVVRYKAY